MTDSEFAALLRSKRTLTPKEVEERARKRDRDDLTPAERLSQYGM